MLEKLLTSTEVARLEGRSTRSLYDHIKKKTFPEPDFPAKKLGEPHRWLVSTVQRAREERLSKVLDRDQAA